MAERYRTIVADPPWSVMAGPVAGGVGDGWNFDSPKRSGPRPRCVWRNVICQPLNWTRPRDMDHAWMPLTDDKVDRDRWL